MMILLGACALPSKSAGDNEPSTSSDPGSPSGDTEDSADSATSYQPPVGGTSMGSTPGTAGDPSGPTCRDAIDCVVGCAAELTQMDPPEQDPDLTCFLECEEGLTTDEALKLFQLTECVTDKCIDQGVCEALEAGSTTGEPDTGSSTGGSGSGGPSPSNPCLDCILANMFDMKVGGECQEFADLCQ